MNEEEEDLKGSQATPRNQRNYAILVAKLKATGEKFPSNQFGTVSIEGVAEMVGCTTKVLTKGSLKTQFEKDVREIGVGVKKVSDSRLAQKAEEKSREASSLSKHLNIKIKECESLRAENERLVKENRQIRMRQKEDELSLQELLKTGRRFTL
jgi:vacuolar-type H+-ATPase subunit I/STV1